MTLDVHIRLAADGDFDAIAAITNHYIRHTAIHFGAEDVPAATLRALWCAHADVYGWLVAERHGEVVGYAKAGEFRTRAAYRWTTETGIYLAPAHRGRGLGAPLYRRLLEVLRAQGFHTAVGGITLPNPASVRLHERLGFVHWGTVAHAGRKFDAWHDVGFWQLMLQPADHAPQPLLSPAAAFAS
ncbi:MAG: N-acetyltransferase [Planctomycetes bacterium]|nr:N-acetyltransferase [Planctomycetota bacterium]